MKKSNRLKENGLLAIIPARAGSKRIKNKNIRNFLGKPLIAYTIEQALECPIIDRVIVDTDSQKIASIAKRYGAEVPFLRPAHLATDHARVEYSVKYLLNKLHVAEKYSPRYFIILQTTSPLRELKDIQNCWNLIKKTKATTVLTVCPTHPKLYHLSKNNSTTLVNGSEKSSNNTQTWRKAYILNGCFVYIVKTDAFLREKIIITKKTEAVVCEKWRSIDIDNPEDWALAELLYTNKKRINNKILSIK